METTPDELWSPDAVDPYQLAIDLAHMQQTAQDAITALRGTVKYKSGTDAARVAAAGASAIGDRWVVTNLTPRREYFSTGGAWVLDYIPRTNWTPVWNNFILGGSTLNHASYCVTGGRCIGDISVTIGSGFAMSGSTISFIPPVAAILTSSSVPAGSGIYLNSGTGYYAGPLMHSATGIELRADMGSFVAGVNGTGNPFGWDATAGDQISLSFNFPVN